MLYPISPMWGTQVQLASFLETQHVVKNEKTARNYVSRLEAMGGKLDALTAEIDALGAEFSEAAVQAAFERVLAHFGLKLGQLAQPVRVAITGGTVSPGIYEVIGVLGRERTVARLRSAAATIASAA